MSTYEPIVRTFSRWKEVLSVLKTLNELGVDYTLSHYATTDNGDVVVRWKVVW